MFLTIVTHRVYFIPQQQGEHISYHSNKGSMCFTIATRGVYFVPQQQAKREYISYHSNKRSIFGSIATREVYFLPKQQGVYIWFHNNKVRIFLLPYQLTQQQGEYISYHSNNGNIYPTIATRGIHVYILPQQEGEYISYHNNKESIFLTMAARSIFLTTPTRHYGYIYCFVTSCSCTYPIVPYIVVMDMDHPFILLNDV